MKKNSFTTWLVIGAVIATISLFSPKSSDPAPTGNAKIAASETATPDGDLVPSEEPSQVELAYWPDGLDVEDVTYSDASGRDCTFDICMFVKVTALKTCSGVTLDGETYDATDEPVDDFSEDLGSMKKGASRIFELGTDTIDDTEEYVDLYDSTCWK